MKKIILAIDFDGTIIDCRERQVAVVSHVMRQNGFSINIEEYWQRKRSGFSNFDILCDLLKDKALAKRLTHQWVAQIEKPVWLTLDQPLSGASAALAVAKNKGLEITLITARQNAEGVTKTLDRTGLRDYFNVVYVVPVERAVEKKTCVLRAIKADWMVGDSETDFRAAENSGTQFVAVSTGQRNPEYLISLGATVKTCLMDAIDCCIIT